MIGFVILHYQAAEETENCVHSIRCNVPEHRIVIVDNASPNGSGTYLAEKYAADPDVEVILNSRNRGYASGNNTGYRKLRENCSFLVVLNSDVEITQRDFAERIEKAYRESSFDILGPDIFSTRYNYHQNPQRVKNYTRKELLRKEVFLAVKVYFPILLRLKYALIRNRQISVAQENNYHCECTGQVLHGACYIFSERYIRTHEQCFYEGTFLYYESYILHYLSMKEGLKLLYSPDIRVIHHEDASTNAVYGEQYRKSLFVNRCMLDSLRVFVRLIREKGEL